MLDSSAQLDAPEASRPSAISGALPAAVSGRLPAVVSCPLPPAGNSSLPAAVSSPVPTAMSGLLALPPRRTVDVWLLPLDQFAGPVLQPVLEDAERDLTAADPARSAARVATRIILARYCGVSPAQLRFASGPFGKPELLDADLTFSLSRRENIALLAVAAEGSIGVDLEMRRPVPELDGIAAMLHPAEGELLARTTAGEREDCFLRIWTRKEAALKALGIGLTNGLDEFCVTADQIFSPPLALRDIEIGHGYFAAVAAEPGVENARLLKFPSGETSGAVRR